MYCIYSNKHPSFTTPPPPPHANKFFMQEKVGKKST